RPGLRVEPPAQPVPGERPQRPSQKEQNHFVPPQRDQPSPRRVQPIFQAHPPPGDCRGFSARGAKKGPTRNVVLWWGLVLPTSPTQRRTLEVGVISGGATRATAAVLRRTPSPRSI